MNVQPIKTRIFREGEDLFDFIVGKVPRLSEKSILVITSKIVSFSEGRTRRIINKKTKEQLIKKESQWVMRTKYAWLTIKDGVVMRSAGIDRSNADGKLALLPKDSFRTARIIRKKLQKHYGVKKLGVLITDSHLYPLCSSIMGVALGYAGFEGIRDYRGSKDIFGRTMKRTKTDVADSLATAAILVMGEGAERQPLTIIKEAPVVFTDRAPSRQELYIDPREDLYQPLFERVKKIRLRKRRP
ncbi:MAG: coenzyme F420-0:L-glutamate ligase [Patescibacteria group bacterium]|nr:coenzyme F420-0:L-glutamate ligase [Patescibacteria group bacterium]